MAGFFKGLVFGSIVGGLTGLMNAPRSGQETREQIKIYIDQTTEDVNDVRYKVDNLSQAIQRLAGEGLQSIQVAKDDITFSIQQFSQETQPRINRVMRNVEDIQTTVQENLKES